ncbi:GFA family protein [Amorphus sp. 3PC139-8]|uniref:GFA family protein n=1 Tax=Amorphus sp. 3PC139-8 TaxID=2735676 RepID=UPI00345D47CA
MGEGTMTDGPKSGGCACGAVRFAATVKGTHMDACHCETCRHWSAGPLMGVEVQDLTIEDETSLGVWDSSPWAERLFCTRCGTSIGYRMKDGSFTTLSAFVSDTPLDFPLGTEIFVDSKPASYAFAGDAKQMTGADVVAMFGGN